MLLRPHLSSADDQPPLIARLIRLLFPWPPPSSSVSFRRGAEVGALMVQDSRGGCLGRPVRGKLLGYIASDKADAAP